MSAWEHLMVDYGSTEEARPYLLMLGREGWELVSDVVERQRWWFFFKRLADDPTFPERPTQGVRWLSPDA